MRNKNPKIVEIIDEEILMFMCKECGRVWVPMIKHGGGFCYGHWQCPNGCRK